MGFLWKLPLIRYVLHTYLLEQTPISLSLFKTMKNLWRSSAKGCRLERFSATCCPFVSIRSILGDGISLSYAVKYSPSWVPFQRRIAKGRDIINRGVRAPFEEVRRLVHANKASPSISRDLIMSGDWGDPKMFQRASWAVADVYGGKSSSWTLHRCRD